MLGISNPNYFAEKLNKQIPRTEHKKLQQRQMTKGIWILGNSKVELGGAGTLFFKN